MSAVKAGTHEHFRAEVTMEGTEAKGDQYSIALSVEKSPMLWESMPSQITGKSETFQWGWNILTYSFTFLVSLSESHISWLSVVSHFMPLPLTHSHISNIFTFSARWTKFADKFTQLNTLHTQRSSAICQYHVASFVSQLNQQSCPVNIRSFNLKSGWLTNIINLGNTTIIIKYLV